VAMGCSRFRRVILPSTSSQLSIHPEAVLKASQFGQPRTTMPNAQKSLNNAVFGPQASQKLHNNKLFVPSAQN
jgi:hypothetical protein